MDELKHPASTGREDCFDAISANAALAEERKVGILRAVEHDADSAPVLAPGGELLEEYEVPAGMSPHAR